MTEQYVVWAGEEDEQPQAVRGPFASAEEAMADVAARPIIGMTWDVCTLAEAIEWGVDVDAVV
jgi:hypothetical protein